MEFLYLVFYACLRLRFLEVETNPGQRRPVPAAAEYSVVMCGAWLLTFATKLAVVSSQYWWLLCSETLVSAMRHVSELLVSEFGRPVLLFLGQIPIGAWGMAAFLRDGYGAFRQPKFECGCYEMLFLQQSFWDRFFVFSLYRIPDLDDRIFDCLLASMAAVQAEDVRASFRFAGDLNSHHWEWLGSVTTNSHWVEDFDFATVSGWDKLVVGPTYARGGTHDLLLTDVPDLVRIPVISPIVNSDHSSLSAVISIAQVVPNWRVSWKVFLKHQVNWNTVCGAMHDPPWRNMA